MTSNGPTRITAPALAFVALAWTVGPRPADAQDEEKKMRNVYHDRLVDMSNLQSGLAAMADFVVTGWTNTAERDVLITTLRDEGHSEFIKALRMREEKGFSAFIRRRHRDREPRASAPSTSSTMTTAAVVSSSSPTAGSAR